MMLITFVRFWQKIYKMKTFEKIKNKTNIKILKLKELETNFAVFGLNNISRFFLEKKIINVCIIDALYKAELEKKPNNKYITFTTLDLISKNTVIINCISGIKAGLIKKKLNKLEFINYSWIEFKNAFGLNGINYWYLDDFNSYFFKNFDKFLDTYKLLYDFKSKKQFIKILKYKVVGNENVFNNDFNILNQYFPEFIKFNNQSVFIDVGAFDGDTISHFLKLNHNFKKIIAFEPDKKNFKLLKKTHQENQKIELNNLALGSNNIEQNFNSEKDTSKITDYGTQIVKVKRLDELNHCPTYIKVDIEGSEADFILGAANTIMKYKPILAICVYHKPEDFFYLVNQILKINSEYKLYFRHHSLGFTESVMYFV